MPRLLTALTAAFVLVSVALSAPARAADPTCPDDVRITVKCRWVISHVETVPGERRGKWKNCAEAVRSRKKQHITCALGKSVSGSVTTSVGGEYPVGKGKLSASVGYSVTTTTSETKSDTFDVGKGESGWVQWAPVFSDRRDVYQKYQRCSSPPKGGGKPLCRDLNVPEKVAHTERYSHPAFRFKDS